MLSAEQHLSEDKAYLGLAPKGVYITIFVTKNVVGSYPTISTLPTNRRYIFCCTFPEVTLAGRYPALVPC